GPVRQNQRRERQQDEGDQADMRDPRALRGRTALHQSKKSKRQPCDQNGLERDTEEDVHYLPPFALRARAIICSSSSSSFSSSLPDMPSSALAAFAGDPLKNVFTISLSADFFAAFSDSTGLYRKPRSDSLRWTKPLSSSRLSIARTAEPLRGSGSASQISATGRAPRSERMSTICRSRGGNLLSIAIPFCSAESPRYICRVLHL